MTADTIATAPAETELTGAARQRSKRSGRWRPRFATRGDEIERGRRLPPDLVTQLREAGCFRLLVPESHGGAEVTLADHMPVMGSSPASTGRLGGP